MVLAAVVNAGGEGGVDCVSKGVNGVRGEDVMSLTVVCSGERVDEDVVLFLGIGES